MSNTFNLSSPIARTNVGADELIQQLPMTEYGYLRDFGNEPDYVLDGGGGYELPDAEAYAHGLAEEAEAWLYHARARSRLKEVVLVRKALHGLAFSLRWRTNHLCVPTKLVGTSKHQPKLWAMVKGNVGFGTLLNVEEVSVGHASEKRPRLVVFCEGEELGALQSKWVPVLRPLLRFGAEVRLIRVTGQESTFTLGCNITMALNDSVAALNHALGNEVGGGGYGGDGAFTEAAQASPKAAPIEGQQLPDHGGDGAAGSLRLVSSGLPVANPQEVSPSADDVVLYRDIDGTARATVNHVARHSHAIEWGYHGSGPADLARSVLLAFTAEATADTLYQRFKAEVIAAVPKAGGVIRAADVQAWLAANYG